MGEITVIILSIGMVILCWVMIRLNDKIDRQIKRFKKLENALIKNSTRSIKTTDQQLVPGQTSGKVMAPTAQTSHDLRPKGLNFIAKD
ncbi:MAG: hypothetical protein J7K40_00045 [candidate division Zixibacteria bacterium]|nr:hypothetical protein [candidate division Zixibacteria bacterium]